MNNENKSKFASIKGLFFRETKTPQTNTLHTANATSGTSTSTTMFDNNLVETFTKKLQALMEQNNQPGFDFIEFTETLFEEDANPSAEQFKTVYRIATKMDKSLTPAKLIQSANFYKGLVEQAADSELAKGETKRNTLTGEKESEVKSLKQTQSDADNQILALEEQIRGLQAKSATASTQLLAIDAKYDEKFADVDTKMNAIKTAKEQVVSSIMDVESGITTNLK